MNLNRWGWLEKSGLLIIALVAALFSWYAGLERSEAQLSLQLKGQEAELQPPEEAIPRDEFARFNRSVGSFGIVTKFFDDPIDLVVDEDEIVYVLERNNERVQLFNSRLEFVSKFGRPGSGEGEFDRPEAIAIDQVGFIYVVDSLNHRIQKFEPGGDFLLEWGSLGSSEGLFNTPRDITFDEENVAYVADTGNDRIQIFTPGGRFLDEWNQFDVRRNTGATFRKIVSLAFDDDRFGFILALRAVDKTIQRFELDADLWDRMSICELEDCLPVRMEVDNRDDFIYLVDRTGNRILKYTKGGVLAGQLIGGDVPFANPSGLYVDRGNKRLYVADSGNDKIQKFYLQ